MYKYTQISRFSRWQNITEIEKFTYFSNTIRLRCYKRRPRSRWFTLKSHVTDSIYRLCAFTSPKTTKSAQNGRDLGMCDAQAASWLLREATKPLVQRNTGKQKKFFFLLF